MDFDKEYAKEQIKDIEDANARFRNKKKEELCATIPAQFIDDFSRAMDYEDNGYYARSRDLCVSILNRADTNPEAVKVMLARVYPKLLETDIYDRNGRYQADADEYFEFLDGLEMNDIMQGYIVETLAKFCELLDNEWFRPLFRDFVKTVEKKEYLTKEEYRKTINSAYASVESTLYYEDTRVDIVMKNVLKSGYDREYLLDGLDSEDKKQKMKLNIYTNLYYLSKHMDGCEEQIDYIAANYPYSYETIEKDVEILKYNKEKKTDEILEELSKFTSDKFDKNGLKDAMDKAYNYVITSRPKPTLIHTGKTPYYRTDGKIGRNDLCPCGSGKKYKQCCGK